MSLPEPLFDYEACLASCSQGDRQALRDLYQQESARLLGVAQRIARDNALAEDILHDVFLRIWTRASSFDPTRGSARGWIYSVTRHLALNLVRNHGREVHIDEQAETATAEHLDTFEYQARSGRIYTCLEHLDPARRNCILHAYVDGYSHSEIAQKVGAPLGTVKAWIKRSLAALRECMG
ncbi:sigma-70 family RNA polymerase sigma factor [Pseudomonas sp. TE3610]